MKRLTVVLSPLAASDLLGILEFNRERYGDARAQSYLAFLMKGIRRLATTYDKGRQVEGFPGLQGVTLKRRTRGDGHVVLYEVDQKHVNVAHVFHTKMDVEGRLKREGR